MSETPTSLNHLEAAVDEHSRLTTSTHGKAVERFWSNFGKVVWTFLATCLLCVNLSGASGWIILALLVHAVWVMKIIWTNKHA